MNISISANPRLNKGIKTIVLAVLAIFIGGLAAFYISERADAQGVDIRLGEKITYNVSFERYKDVAYAEIYAISEGRLNNKNAIELRGRIRTKDFFGAAFHFVDEMRTTFVSSENGLPLYVEKNENGTGLPRETTYNYLNSPTLNLDLLAMIYKIRSMGGAGTLPLQENDKNYTVTFQPTIAEKIKTDAGEFETTVVTVQSEFLTELGLKDVRINLSNDDARIPVLVRGKTSKGEFRAVAASVAVIEPEVEVQATPAPMRTPAPPASPTPAPTPLPYIDNQPLAPELAFALGETLKYQISTAGMPIGSFTLQAKERKQFRGMDSLLLSAVVTESRPGNSLFAVGDSITAYVNAETLAASQIEFNLKGSLNSINGSAVWDAPTGSVIYNKSNHAEVPVGTQSILSLLYAIRSFKLAPSPVLSNPVNDTRVAVFWETKPYIFTLRPSQTELINLQGEKVSAQLVTITTGHAVLDRLEPKIWLGTDAKRLPLRFSLGPYLADLVSVTNIPPQ